MHFEILWFPSNSSPISMQTQCAVCFSFFSLPVQGLYSVTVISGPALVTFSLSHLGEKMQKTTISPQNDVCSRGPEKHSPPLAHLLCPDQEC